MLQWLTDWYYLFSLPGYWIIWIKLKVVIIVVYLINLGHFKYIFKSSINSSWPSICSAAMNADSWLSKCPTRIYFSWIPTHQGFRSLMWSWRPQVSGTVEHWRCNLCLQIVTADLVRESCHHLQATRPDWSTPNPRWGPRFTIRG